MAFRDWLYGHLLTAVSAGINSGSVCYPDNDMQGESTILSLQKLWLPYMLPSQVNLVPSQVNLMHIPLIRILCKQHMLWLKVAPKQGYVENKSWERLLNSLFHVGRVPLNFFFFLNKSFGWPPLFCKSSVCILLGSQCKDLRAMRRAHISHRNDKFHKHFEVLLDAK